jgi:hypothetical protein
MQQWYPISKCCKHYFSVSDFVSMLKILRKWRLRVWIRLKWVRIRFSGWLIMNMVMNIHFPEIARNFLTSRAALTYSNTRLYGVRTYGLPKFHTYHVENSIECITPKSRFCKPPVISWDSTLKLSIMSTIGNDLLWLGFKVRGDKRTFITLIVLCNDIVI